MNYIWAGMIIISLVFGAFNGNLEGVVNTAMTGSTAAVTTAISLLGIMALWTGLMKIAEQSGLMEKFSRLIRPIIKIIFPKLPQKSAAENAIVANMAANMLGMSNAATPLGIKAMEELSKISNRIKTIASNEMAMFVVINTASIQFIPATVIALRQLAGNNPSEIIVPVWISSLITVTIGISIAKLFSKKC